MNNQIQSHNAQTSTDSALSAASQLDISASINPSASSAHLVSLNFVKPLDRLMSNKACPTCGVTPEILNKAIQAGWITTKVYRDHLWSVCQSNKDEPPKNAKKRMCMQRLRAERRGLFWFGPQRIRNRISQSAGSSGVSARSSSNA